MRAVKGTVKELAEKFGQGSSDYDLVSSMESMKVF